MLRRLPLLRPLIAKRFARQLPNSRRAARSREEPSQTIVASPIIKDAIEPLHRPTSKSKGQDTDDEATPEFVMLDMMNRARPGTETDKRYSAVKASLKGLNVDAKLKSLAEFILNEVKRDLVIDSNPDEMVDPNATMEDSLEFSIRREILQGGQKESPIIVKFKAILSILEGLNEDNGGVLKLSPEYYVEVFQISQYFEDEEIKLRARYISGTLIYKLKKFEMDVLSESQYIEALIEFGQHKEAEKLLTKRSEKVQQRWWYELMIINYIEIGNLNGVENVLQIIYGKFGDYLDPRIYLLLINRYLNSENFEQLNYWIDKYQKQIQIYGFTDEIRSPGVDSTEEEALEFLNREDQVKKEDYLGLIDSILKSDEQIPDPNELIKFYLKQDNTSLEDLYPCFLNFKNQYSKLRSILEKLPNKNEQRDILINFFEDYKKENPTEVQQSEFINQYFSSLRKSGSIGAKLLNQQINAKYNEDSKLDSTLMFNWIEGLCQINAPLDKILSLITRMEESLQVYKKGNSKKIDQLILPPIESKHYLPILRKLGRSNDLEQFIKMVKRFETNIGIYNPIILTRIITSFNKMKRKDLAIRYINEILNNDLHKQDGEFDKDDHYTKLYMSIWQCLKSSIREINYKENQYENFPDLRFVFMKMIHDKAIPRSKDYFDIISCFLYNNDREGIICALEYLGKIHKLAPDFRTVKLLDRSYKSLNALREQDQHTETIVNQEQSEKLKMLNLQGHSSSSDPIMKLFGNEPGENNTDKDIIDLTTPEESTTQNLVYKVEIYKMVKYLKQFKLYDEVSLKQVFNSFELEYTIESTLKEVEELREPQEQ